MGPSAEVELEVELPPSVVKERDTARDVKKMIDVFATSFWHPVIKTFYQAIETKSK